MENFYIILIVLLLSTAYFYIRKKKLPCFICSIIGTLLFFFDAYIEKSWGGMLFWGIGFLLDLYFYKQDSWDVWGHFDD